MGTSKSSTGPGQHVGLIPPWLNSPNSPVPDPLVPNAPIPNAQPEQVPLPNRFIEARRAFGNFISTGQLTSLQRGLGSYVGKGYRGSGNASARMGQAATSASRAFSLLTGIAHGTIPLGELGIDLATIANAPMEVVVDALVDAICGDDTTLDDGAGRQAVYEALSEVLDENPDIDPLAMHPEAVREVFLRTLAYHVWEDILLDIGYRLQHGAHGDAKLFNDRCVEIREFIRESYREQLEAIESQGKALSKGTCDAIAREVNALALGIFESWFE